MDVFDDVDDKLMVFESLFLDILDEYAPWKSVWIKKKPALGFPGQSGMKWTSETLH